MKTLNYFKIGTKLNFGFVFVLLLLITVAVVGYVAINDGQKTAFPRDCGCNLVL
jgi:CHASE3 domain sensor protein